MDMMTLTEADVLTARALASAVQTIRLPDESTEEAVARWKASTPRDERMAVLASHRAVLEQADADERARVNAEAAAERAQEKAAVMADVSVACATLRALLEKFPADPYHGAILSALDRRERGAA